MVLQYANKKQTAKEIVVNNNIFEGQLKDWTRKYKKLREQGLTDKRETRKKIDN